MSRIDIDQAKGKFEELVEQVARGEEFVITKSNRPIARLSSFTNKRHRLFGSAKGEIWMSEDFDEPIDDFREYM